MTGQEPEPGRPQPEGRRRRLRLAVTLLAPAALLAIWLGVPRGRGPDVGPRRDAPAAQDAEDAPGAAPALATAPPRAARGGPIEDAEGARGPPHRIHVRWKGSGVAVEGAVVALLSRPVDARREVALPASLVVASGRTDAWGDVTLRADAVAAGVWVRERSSSPSSLPLGDRDEGILVELDRAPVIHGRVRTESGEPVSSATLFAWPRALPDAVLDDVGAWTGHARAQVAVSTGTTDASGRFAIPVWGTGPHTVRLSGDWGVAGASRTSVAEDRIEATPDGPPVDFVVEPMALVQVRFVDAETREPLDLAPGLIDVAFESPAVRVWTDGGSRWRRADAATAVEGPADDSDPSIVRWLVRLRPGVAAGSTIALRFNASGYRSGRADVPFTGIGAGAGAVAEVALTSVGRRATGTASLACDGAEAPAGFDVGPGALLFLRGAPGEGGMFVGRRTGSGRWFFRGLPEGTFQGRLSLGHYAESDAFHVRLAAGETARAAVRFDTRAWVALVLLGPEGQRVGSVARVTLWRRQGDGFEPLPGPPESVTHGRTSPDTGETTNGAFNVRPGSYAISCSAPGLGAGEAEFEARAGGFHRVEVRLAPRGTGPR